MNIILQIIGVVILILAFVVGVSSIVHKTSATLTVTLLVVGSSLIRIGRKLT